MSDIELFSAVIDTPVGVLTIVASDRGAAGHPVAHRHRPIGCRSGRRRHDPEHPVIAATIDQLDEYFAGERTEFDLPLDPVGTDRSSSRPGRRCGRIPYGETISYGEQAARIGDRRKARAVGAANGRNPISIVVPCHRVVGTTGSLTGFAGGIDTKAWLLDHERRVAGVTLGV